MINYKQDDVVLVGFTFSDKTAAKNRPGLVLSRSRYNSARGEVIIAAITSNTERVLFGDVLLKDWKEAGLRLPSSLTGIIRTVKKDMIVHKLGKLSEKDSEKVRANLSRITACSDFK